MRALVVLAVVLCLASSVSAIDIVRKQRAQRAQAALSSVQVSAATLRGWDEWKCDICKKMVGGLSDYMIDKIVTAPMEMTADAFCLPADGIFDVACVAIVPTGTVTCQPLTYLFHRQCTSMIESEFNDASKKAKRAAHKLVKADFPMLTPDNLCKKMSMCR